MSKFTGMNINIPLVDLKRQYAAIKEEINPKIQEVLENTDFILGKEVEKFEKDFAAFCNKKHCIGVDSGTSALRLALKAIGIGPGDEVITTSNTFIATTLAISDLGATPVMVDIDKKSFNIDPCMIEKAITSRTKAILPVHLYGQPSEMSSISDIALKRGLKIVEDCCQAHGAKYKDSRVPVTSIGCFSFYPGKNLGCYGDGGAVVTDDPEIADKLRMLRNYGQRQKYYHDSLGGNYRLDNLQAAVLNIKLKYLDDWNSSRRKHAKLFSEILNQALPEGIIITPEAMNDCEHVFHLYVIRVKNKTRDARDALLEYLKTKGVFCGIHYPVPIHLQKAYAHMNLKEGVLPITEKYAREIISLPMFAELTEQEIEYVCKNVVEFVKRDKQE